MATATLMGGAASIHLKSNELAELAEQEEYDDVAAIVRDRKIKARKAITLTDKAIEELAEDEVTRNSIRAARDEFKEAVDRVSTISSERGRAVKLSLAEGQLTLTVNNPDSGSATDELAVGYDSEPMDIGFNAKYLLDICGQLKSGTAVFAPDSTNSGVDVGRYDAETPVLSGYASRQVRDRLKGAAALRASRLGRGRVVLMDFNPAFRAFWYGTDGLLLNAVYLGKTF